MFAQGVLGKDNRHLGSVFFGNQEEFGVKHSGDNLTGEGSGDDEARVLFRRKLGVLCLGFDTRERPWFRYCHVGSKPEVSKDCFFFVFFCFFRTGKMNA